MLSLIVLSVIMLNVVALLVVAPSMDAFKEREKIMNVK
jgi:hypothetical protein